MSGGWGPDSPLTLAPCTVLRRILLADAVARACTLVRELYRGDAIVPLWRAKGEKAVVDAWRDLSKCDRLTADDIKRVVDKRLGRKPTRGFEQRRKVAGFYETLALVEPFARRGTPRQRELVLYLVRLQRALGFLGDLSGEEWGEFPEAVETVFHDSFLCHWLAEFGTAAEELLSLAVVLGYEPEVFAMSETMKAE